LNFFTLKLPFSLHDQQITKMQKLTKNIRK